MEANTLALQLGCTIYNVAELDKMMELMQHMLMLFLPMELAGSVSNNVFFYCQHKPNLLHNEVIVTLTAKLLGR